MPVLVIHLAFPLFSYVPQDGSRVIPQDIPEIESLLSDFQLLVARSISDVLLSAVYLCGSKNLACQRTACGISSFSAIRNQDRPAGYNFSVIIFDERRL